MRSKEGYRASNVSFVDRYFPGYNFRRTCPCSATTSIAVQCTNDFLWNHTEIKVEDDLLAPGAKPGTIPSDVDQATGLERLELIGKMQGVDIFDMRPLDASRKGT